MPELIAYAKANPSKVNFAAIGNFQRIYLALLNERAGIQMVEVPFKGTPDIIPALVNNDVQVSFMATSTGLPLAKDKRITFVAVPAAKRAPGLPDLPTVTETVPGYVMDYWVGFFTKASVPRVVIDRWSAGVRDAVRNPDLQRTYAAQGFVPAAMTPEDMAAYVRKETATMAAAAKKLGIEPQ